MEEKVIVSSPVLSRYYEDFLELRELLNKLDLSLFGQGGPEAYLEDYGKLLKHVMNFADALYSALLSAQWDEKTKQGIKNALFWLNLYRENKEAFVLEADGVYVTYVALYKLPGESGPSHLRTYTTRAELEKDRKELEAQDMKLVKVLMLPSLSLLRFLARMIIIRALDLGLFGFKIERKPRFWWGD